MTPLVAKRSEAVAGVLLAGGAACRFGSDKLLAPLADGTPVIVASARALRAVLPRVVVVVRPHAEALRNALRGLDLQFVEAPLAEQGMGHSVAAGVGAAADAVAWLIALGDMPRVKNETLEALVAALHAGHEIVVPRFHGERGNPVGFAVCHLEALRALQGDQGARGILKAHPARVHWVDVADPGILLDIDTPKDLAELGRDASPTTRPAR